MDKADKEEILSLLESLNDRLSVIENTVRLSKSCDVPLTTFDRPAVVLQRSVPSEMARASLVSEGKQVVISNYKKCVLVTGNTKEIKDVLIKNGGKWNFTLVGWIFFKKSVEDLISDIESTEIELINNLK